MQNPFTNTAFSMTALTNAMNILPINYGRVENLNLFPSRSVRFRHITIEEHNGVLSLLPTQVPGAPATVGKRGKRKVRTFTIPHIPHDDVVLPEEVQGIRAFGSESELKALADVITDHLQLMRNKHAITLEHLRMGALKGIILDADGSELLNLYNEFEITPKVVNFALGTATTDVKRKCMEVLRHIEDNLSGEYMTGVHALVNPEFFDALTSHSKVKEAYERWQEGAALRNDMRSGFTFCGITFEEYRGQATDPEGTVRRFIEKDTGHCFPLGTASTFTTYFAPADFNETVNTLGQPLYAKQEPRRFDRGTDLHTQSNPLPMCHRPGTLVKVVAA
ncbi:major capsid protein [Wolbachia endosymbiont of Culex quinquefasciatus]|uniref:major capsid protein n=2 Tax=unclassified Wolbachia TaxID=2640676 RepID=UPI00017620B5|nr:major capsid protein [Wolbachia endosymbiont of Culex quinquefasciatus]CAQ55409.1 Putative phage related protein [Wolbachia endosymbiont of Culex quinquefasciatus Pel]